MSTSSHTLSPLDGTPINLSARLFGASGFFKRPRINEAEPYFTEGTYRALKQYFLSEADNQSASWASYCEKLMGKEAGLEAGQNSLASVAVVGGVAFSP